MGCIAWMGLDGNLQVSESVTLSRKRPKVQWWRMKKEPRDQATCTAHTDKKCEFVSKFSHNISIPLHFSPPMAVQSNRSHGSQSFPSSGYVTDGLSVSCLESTLLESPWYIKAKLIYSEVRSDC